MFKRNNAEEEYYKCKYEYIKEENNKLLVENTHLKYKMSSYDCQEAEIKKLKQKNNQLLLENKSLKYKICELEKETRDLRERNTILSQKIIEARLCELRKDELCYSMDEKPKKKHLRDMRINGFKNYCPNCGNRGQLYYDEDDNIICVHCLQTYLKSNGAGISGYKNLEKPGC